MEMDKRNDYYALQMLKKVDTLPSLNVDLDPGGYLEDLGLILAILAIMVSSI